jgi:hypothetical protein
MPQQMQSFNRRDRLIPEESGPSWNVSAKVLGVTDRPGPPGRPAPLMGCRPAEGLWLGVGPGCPTSQWDRQDAPARQPEIRLGQVSSCYSAEITGIMIMMIRDSGGPTVALA